ncbi:MAG: HD domain-containing protein, partial [Aquificae bacterium]|nr:HD domain-containing protein [Aquificota bacterium]
MKERLALFLGGLLHDVGKLYVKRSRSNPFGDYEKDFKYLHAAYSYEFIKSRVSEELRDLALQAAFHHKPESSHPDAKDELYAVRKLYQAADQFVSKERS